MIVLIDTLMTLFLCPKIRPPAVGETYSSHDIFPHAIYDRTLIEHNTLTLSIERLPKPALKKGSMFLCSILTYRNYLYAFLIINLDTEEICKF